MIFITGDTHGGFQRFATDYFPQQKQMGRNDYVIVTGDLGGIWDDSPKEAYWLDWLEEKPFTTLFVDGNHENFTALSKYPVEEWNGGKAQFLRPHVIHLMHGQIFTLEERAFLTMGGASSHDVGDGILDSAAPDYHERLLRLLIEGKRQYRILGQSWWPEELPSEEEYAEARKNLDACGWAVDYIITHSSPSGLAEELGRPRDKLTDFLEEIRQKGRYCRWMFGHCHGDQTIDEKHLLLWEQIVQVNG